MSNQFKRTPTCGENDVDLRVATEPRRAADRLTASVQFHELAQGYRAATPDGAQAAYEKLCAFLEGRAAPVAESVGDDPKFYHLLSAVRDAYTTAKADVARQELIAYIDSRCAPAAPHDLSGLTRYGWTEAYLGECSDLVEDEAGTYVKFADVSARIAAIEKAHHGALVRTEMETRNAAPVAQPTDTTKAKP